MKVVYEDIVLPRPGKYDRVFQEFLKSGKSIARLELSPTEEKRVQNIYASMLLAARHTPEIAVRKRMNDLYLTRREGDPSGKPKTSRSRKTIKCVREDIATVGQGRNSQGGEDENKQEGLHNESSPRV